METTCSNCSLGILDIYPSFEEDDSRWINFLRSHSLIEIEKNCPKCGEICSMTKRNRNGGAHFFSCNRRYIPDDEDFKPKKCNFLRSIYVQTWFEKSKFNPCQHLLLVRLHSEDNFKREEASKLLKISEKTLCDYTNFCRDVFIDIVYTNSTMVGGEGKVVQIDEAKFGRRKNHKGRIIEGQWVLGGYKWTTKMAFMLQQKIDQPKHY